VANPAETAAQKNMDSEFSSFVAARIVFDLKQAADFSGLFAKHKILPKVEDAKFLNGLLKKAKDWPKFIAVGPAIYISDGKAKIVIEIKNLDKHEFTINGRVLAYDPTIELRKQLQAIFPRPSNVAWLANALLPKADALGPLSILGLGQIAAGDTAAGNALLAAGLASAGGAGGVTAASLVLVGGVIVLAVAGGYTAYCYRDHPSSMKNFKNCMTAPLSLVGLNWRDNLYLADISCPSPPYRTNRLSVEYVSEAGSRQEDIYLSDPSGRLVTLESVENSRSSYKRVQTTVNFDTDRFSVKRVEIKTSDLVGQEKIKIIDSKSAKELSTYTDSAKDFPYLVELCKDPKRIETLKQAIRTGSRLSPGALEKNEPSTIKMVK